MGILFNVRKCVNCGNKFTTTTSSKYCSIECRNDALIKSRATIVVNNTKR